MVITESAPGSGSYGDPIAVKMALPQNAKLIKQIALRNIQSEVWIAVLIEAGIGVNIDTYVLYGK
jgi:hypothetical protein